MDSRRGENFILKSARESNKLAHIVSHNCAQRIQKEGKNILFKTTIL